MKPAGFTQHHKQKMLGILNCTIRLVFIGREKMSLSGTFSVGLSGLPGVIYTFIVMKRVARGDYVSRLIGQNRAISLIYTLSIWGHMKALSIPFHMRHGTIV